MEPRMALNLKFSCFGAPASAWLAEGCVPLEMLRAFLAVAMGGGSFSGIGQLLGCSPSICSESVVEPSTV